MASAKQIEAWAREVTAGKRAISVKLYKARVVITVDGAAYELATRAVDFAQVAAALLSLGPSCAEEGAEPKR